MIKNKKDLKEYIHLDNNWQISQSLKARVVAKFAHYEINDLKLFLYYLRMQEYYINTAKGNKIKGVLAILYERKKNILGEKLGIEIGPNCFGKGLNLYHGGDIINPNAKIGDNCSLHGANCIGNNGLTKAVPIIGNNVDIGYGAVIFGDIEIADDIKIGANAVVNKSFCEKGCTIAGIPAKIVKRGSD